MDNKVPKKDETEDSTTIFVRVYINKQYLFTEGIDSSQDIWKLAELDKSQIDMQSLREDIAQVFRQTKWINTIFKNKKKYQWKIFSYDQSKADIEIECGDDLQEEINKFITSDSEHPNKDSLNNEKKYLELRVLFFEIDEDEIKELPPSSSKDIKPPIAIQNKEEEINIDFKLFETNTDKCNLSEATMSSPNIINECEYLLRIGASLKYYESLMYNENDESNGREMLIKFMNNTYTTLLNDYIHLIEKHFNHIIIISSQLKAKYQIEQCRLDACKSLRRRYSIRETTDNNSENKTLNDYNFELDLLDNIHFYLIHLQQTGLRIDKTLIQPQKSKLDHSDNEQICTDYEFKALQQAIMSKREKLGLNIDKLDSNTNSKFNISIMENLNQNSDDKSNTFIDNMFKNIQTDSNDSHAHLLQQLSEYIQEQEYDTDVLSYDIDKSIIDSNIFIDVFQSNVNVIFDNLYSFIKYYNISATNFNSGITFWYWSWYKNVTDKQYKIDTASESDEWGRFIPKDEHDLCGYYIRDLFVEPRLPSLKDEVIQSGYITIQQFNTLVIQKANKYFSTTKVKTIKCKERSDPLHYGIKGFPHNEPLHQQHLHSLLLYCDFTDFSQALSSSFRAIKWNESLSSIKHRNSNYYHTAKRLREVIQYYGVRGWGDGSYDNHGQIMRNYGPFYTGMSKVLTVGSFSIRLNGPTSTSRHIEIAIRFATRAGIIIQINNNKGLSRNERYFDCSWLSAFAEEDEQLFCGGRFQLEIQSITIVNTAQNYESFFRAFHLLDSLLSAAIIEAKHVTRRDISKLSMCIDNYLHREQSNLLDSYITDTFHLFTQQKTQIRLNLDKMPWGSKNYIELIRLIDLNILTNDEYTETLKKHIEARKRERNGLLNVTQNDWKSMNALKHLRPSRHTRRMKLFTSWLISKLFRNVSEIIIEADGYPFDLSSLLWMFEQCPALGSITVKVQHLEFRNHTYMDWLCCSNSFVLEERCRKKNIYIEKKRITKQQKSKRRTNAGNSKEEDWLIMSRTKLSEISESKEAEF